MLTVEPITASHASTYYTEPQAGTFKSSWLGEGADRLGLDGTVDIEVFRSILQAEAPGGEKLAPYIHPRRVAGWDCTFSAPKSVSIAVLVEQNREILLAHRQAVVETVNEIERGVSTRVQRNGSQVYETTSNLIGADFQHTLSRESDPQLHNHIVLINATQSSAGWRAPHLKRTLFDRVKELGQFYRERLKHWLERLGEKIRHKGEFIELSRISEAVVQEMSKRKHQVLSVLGENPTYKQKRRATLMTRSSKNEPMLSSLLGGWQERISLANKLENKHHQER